ncbi:MAG TPA: hypothetical protein EYG75_03210 [Campylobacterales bacterium]|nr:hypothetical protein [Campylobacterales bacterium]
MIKIIFISLLFFTTLTANVDFKEGVINYTISGNERGIKTVYFRDYGTEQLIYIKTKSKLMRKNQIIEKIIHVTPTWIYERDLITNKSIKFQNLKHVTLDLVLKQEIRILGFHSKTEVIQIEKKPIDPNIFKIDYKIIKSL